MVRSAGSRMKDIVDSIHTDGYLVQVEPSGRRDEGCYDEAVLCLEFYRRCV